MSESNLKPIDTGFVEEFRDKLAFGISRDFTKLEGIVGRTTMAALANFQPGTRAITQRGVGFVQSGFIGTTILPEVVAAPDGMEQASYPTFGKEALYSAGEDLVQISGDVKRADLGVTWTSVTLDVRGKKAYIDPREQRAAAAAGLNIYEKKAELVKTQVATRKESQIATLLRTTGSYASGQYATLSSGAQFSQYSTGTPIAEVISKIEQTRGLIGVPPNYFWMAPSCFRAIRFHPTVTALIQYQGTKRDPGAPASIETLAALFDINVLVGRSVNTTTPGGALSDIWGDEAGLAFVNDADVFAPQLGMTLTSAGYPKVLTYRSEEQGSEGSEVVKYVEAYKPVITLNSAGYLWTDTTTYV